MRDVLDLFLSFFSLLFVLLFISLFFHLVSDLSREEVEKLNSLRASYKELKQIQSEANHQREAYARDKEDIKELVDTVLLTVDFFKVNQVKSGHVHTLVAMKKTANPIRGEEPITTIFDASAQSTTAKKIKQSSLFVRTAFDKMTVLNLLQIT